MKCSLHPQKFFALAPQKFFCDFFCGVRKAWLSRKVCVFFSCSTRDKIGQIGLGGETTLSRIRRKWSIVEYWFNLWLYQWYNLSGHCTYKLFYYYLIFVRTLYVQIVHCICAVHNLCGHCTYK